VTVGRAAPEGVTVIACAGAYKSRHGSMRRVEQKSSIGDCDDHVRQSIAPKIIDLAGTGECNPDVLCKQVKDIRGGAE
jgi:hypothetical protein